MNVRLRTAIIDARDVSMPKDNIERAIKAGTGELKGSDVEEILYEGYGPGGVAIMCEIMTDNRNRTAPEIRKVFETRSTSRRMALDYLAAYRSLMEAAKPHLQLVSSAE